MLDGLPQESRIFLKIIVTAYVLLAVFKNLLLTKMANQLYLDKDIFRDINTYLSARHCFCLNLWTPKLNNFSSISDWLIGAVQCWNSTRFKLHHLRFIVTNLIQVGPLFTVQFVLFKLGVRYKLWQVFLLNAVHFIKGICYAIINHVMQRYLVRNDISRIIFYADM